MPFQTPWALPDGKPSAGKNFLIHHNGETAPRVSQDSVVSILESDLLNNHLKVGCPHLAEGGGSLKTSAPGLRRRNLGTQGHAALNQGLDNNGGLVALM